MIHVNLMKNRGIFPMIWEIHMELLIGEWIGKYFQSWLEEIHGRKRKKSGSSKSPI